MKKILFVLCLGLVFFGSDLYGQIRVPFDSLITGSGPDPIIHYKGKLFNGIGFSVNGNGQLRVEQNIKDGKYYGLHREWYLNTQLSNFLLIFFSSLVLKFNGIIESG